MIYLALSFLGLVDLHRGAGYHQLNECYFPCLPPLVSLGHRHVGLWWECVWQTSQQFAKASECNRKKVHLGCFAFKGNTRTTASNASKSIKTNIHPNRPVDALKDRGVNCQHKSWLSSVDGGLGQLLQHSFSMIATLLHKVLPRWSITSAPARPTRWYMNSLSFVFVV
jgi:hypothetical protein